MICLWRVALDFGGCVAADREVWHTFRRLLLTSVGGIKQQERGDIPLQVAPDFDGCDLAAREGCS